MATTKNTTPTQAELDARSVIINNHKRNPQFYVTVDATDTDTLIREGFEFKLVTAKVAKENGEDMEAYARDAAAWNTRKSIRKAPAALASLVASGLSKDDILAMLSE